MPVVPSYSGGWGTWAWEVEAAMSHYCTTAIHPGQQEWDLVSKKKKKKKKEFKRPNNFLKKEYNELKVSLEGMRNKEVSERRGITNIYTGSGTVTLHHYYINSTTNTMFSNASKLYFQALFWPQAIFPTTIKYLFHLNFFLLSVTTDLSRFIPINFPTSSLLIFLENIFFCISFIHAIYLHHPSPTYLVNS